MIEFLLTAEPDFERFIPAPDVPEDVIDLTAVGLAYEVLRAEGLKVGYLFVADEARWFVRLELP